ncbi:MerR family transcriptional regulator [Candidatus Galacturonibacter soehngenii]|uniref:MerR family transcriptional regulator n=1 Tax=Candidatus Galacturonatibacter soehngenii TaxID=2307010 RepID=A0A7V7UCJ5_9FIRM|nr:MerR family transcriptional regulator [Candidatus Galacturonibacter soehngenii]KAB1439745.1 MerR family transcriptional regulator [Candidatus Galacturonibacter soehngenii]MBA4688506.1 MerR family transcriptional regulator [Candidatus Galacturonibacter soehngenii]
MTIAQVSKKFDLTADTLRYYERIGLLPRVNRNSSGNRDYTEEDCKWVKFIKCMRNAGLSIEILIEYVSLFQQGKETIDVRKELLKEQRKLINEKIVDLQNTLEYLDNKIDGYEERMLKFEEKLKKFD